MEFELSNGSIEKQRWKLIKNIIKNNNLFRLEFELQIIGIREFLLSNKDKRTKKQAMNAQH